MNLFLKTLAAGLTVSIFVGTTLAQPPTESSGPKRLLPVPDLVRGPKEERRIALTFDADGGNEDMATLLRVLENESITATFFLTGKWADEFPACAAQIVARDHVIGNHTWGHKDLTKLTDSEIEQELLRVDDRFMSLFGCRYLPLFRAPTGEEDGRILAVADKLGFRAVRWSIDTLDSVKPRKTASFIEDRVLGHNDVDLCGAIVVMHVGYPETCAALPVIIHNLRERGFEFVPVSAWVPRLRPDMARIRTSAAPSGLPSIGIAGLGSTIDFTFDVRAPKTVVSVGSSSSLVHQIPGIRNKWTDSSERLLSLRNTTTKP